MIEFRNVWKAFAGHEVLRGLNLTVARGEILFIIGASGVGKSVTIKLLIGLLKVDRGEVWLDGARTDALSEEALRPVRQRCAMVFQHSTLFDSMTVLDNVALPLRKHHRLRPAQAQAQALEFLDKVHMREFAEHLPAALSDGMRKRVAIARALVVEPQLILYDEPTSELDPLVSLTIGREIVNLNQRTGATSVVVTHHRDLAFGIADRIAFLADGQILALGTPAEIRASTVPLIQQFLAAEFK